MLLTFGLLAPGVAALISNSVSFSGNASISERFLQDFDDFDESDLSHIRKIAAIGDSYSAGIGAGDRLGGLQSKSLKVPRTLRSQTDCNEAMVN